MLGRTHEVAAVGAVVSAAVLYPPANITVETAVVSLLMALIGGITPDIDKPGSKIWSNVPAGGIFSRLIHPVFIGGHRHLTHSLLGLALFGLIMRAVLSIAPLGLHIDPNLVLWSFIIALASHLATDMLTKEGVPLLFPLPFHFGFPPFEFLRMRTNGLVENVLITPGIVLGVCALAYSHRESALSLLRILGIG